MKPLFNSKGYTLESGLLRVLQKDGWAEIPLRDVAEIKAPFPSSVAVRLSDGRRILLSLTNLSVTGYRAVIEALKKAAGSHRVRRTNDSASDA